MNMRFMKVTTRERDRVAFQLDEWNIKCEFFNVDVDVDVDVVGLIQHLMLAQIIKACQTLFNFHLSFSNYFVFVLEAQKQIEKQYTAKFVHLKFLLLFR